MEKTIDPKLVEILRCPACDDRPKVELRDDKLVCIKCGRGYAIKNGIPNMLVEESETSETTK